ncbi:hypothetical protein FAM23282_01435 [Lentilactobacillus parabuchneri]|uniref:hypothetical protein n=1 Tax=Lentilactobacillus parabuchneri TaxID=152331 RepID=UPI000A107FE0|nr:hypothetical protein [Lentilactobacillus parabuchneri]MDB1104749.1 hypothetical protein [Lentilactobacillus parabuchneri]ORN39597.1 hypothetical protein FAM23282_01435 [Lentilactobacillus parabuchneri]
MRLARRSLQTIYLRNRTTDSDDEGNSTYSYAEGIPIRVNVQSAGGSVNAAVYGDELAYMKTIIYQGDAIKEGTNEKDGLCINEAGTDGPDYEITAIRTYSDHLIILAGKINHD